jgi:hypothetical protein
MAFPFYFALIEFPISFPLYFPFYFSGPLGLFFFLNLGSPAAVDSGGKNVWLRGGDVGFVVTGLPPARGSSNDRKRAVSHPVANSSKVGPIRLGAPNIRIIFRVSTLTRKRSMEPGRPTRGNTGSSIPTMSGAMLLLSKLTAAGASPPWLQRLPL